jgi:hypothetical protein
LKTQQRWTRLAMKEKWKPMSLLKEIPKEFEDPSAPKRPSCSVLSTAPNQRRTSRPAHW